MHFIDQVEEMVLGVTANKVRSGLTMLGIVIGIASVIAMLSVGQGTKKQIEDSISSIGSNLLLVMPGAQRSAGTVVRSAGGSAKTLTMSDAEALKSIPGVKAVEADSSSRVQVTTKGSNTNTQVIGTTPAYTSVRNVSMDTGTFITQAHITSRAKVAVIGPTVRDDLFGENATAIGQRIRISGMEYTVIGLTKTKGGSGFSNADDAIYIPLSTMSAYISGSEYVSTIGVQAESQEVMTTVQESINALLLQRHKVTTADFSVMNQSDLVSTASSVTGTLTLLLASIAGISLLVGGIGIMNMMLTTVTERTREIGLRKAIGARSREIIVQFLGEAMIETMVGGAIGIALGYGISKLISTFASMETVVPMWAVGLAFGVSTGIGLVFGYYPARRASRLNPINALRYE
ncbi:MAG: ABC transporter permease [Candidatus Uhrbacteria bacterium]|nr:ABC transporter permease [Candidatus Uhrbacteria bacterium]